MKFPSHSQSRNRSEEISPPANLLQGLKNKIRRLKLIWSKPSLFLLILYFLRKISSVYHRIHWFISSVRSSNSHTDLLLIHHPTHPHFFRSHRSSTLDFHFLSHYSYIKTIMLYKGNHWTRCAGFMDASWVQLGITNDDLGTSWALPGDNLGMTWG